MAVLTATATKGLTYLEGGASLYTSHDDVSDNKVAGVYSHNPLEGSATEQDEVVSILLALIQNAYMVKQSVAAGQTFTIQSGYAFITASPFQNDGTIVNNGTMVVL